MISRDPKPKNPWIRRSMVTGLAASAALLAACNSNETTQATSDSTPPSSSDLAPSTSSSNEIPSSATSVTIESPTASSETSGVDQEPKTLAEKYTIEANDLDPTKFGDRFCQALNDWSTEGFTEDSLKDPAVWNNGSGAAAGAAYLVGNSDSEIIKALFVANPDQGTQNFIDDMVKRHESTIEKKILTGLGIEFGDDKEIYKRVLTCTQTVENSDGTSTYTMSVNDKDNGDMNRVGKANGGALDQNSSYTVVVKKAPTGAAQILSITTSSAAARQ